MKQTFFTLLFILYSITATAQTRGSSEQALQELAQKIIGRQIENLEENPGLLVDVQDILRPHSDFLFNTLPGMQTDPELEHCDLEQQHHHNDIMDVAWQEDLLNSRAINWQPLYEEFFMIRERNKIIVCSEENAHLYRECQELYSSEGAICPGEETLCYRWKESIIDGIRSMSPYLECLLFNSNGSVCSSFRS